MLTKLTDLTKGSVSQRGHNHARKIWSELENLLRVPSNRNWAQFVVGMFSDDEQNSGSECQSEGFLLDILLLLSKISEMEATMSVELRFWRTNSRSSRGTNTG